MKSKLLNKFSKLILFLPLLLYFGQRSYIAYDEGFYALQARWIIKNNNWIIPMWWDQYVVDRTIGIQYLIAKSQQLFGQTSFAAHLPTTISAGLILFLTYKLHQELISKKDAIYSSLILASTYIWLDFAHLANQDMIFACLVTLGIYSITKLKQSQNYSYLFIFGVWIGLAFMMKTFLIAIPLLALIPELVFQRKLFNKEFFWYGIIFGFLPFVIWSISISQYLDKNIIFFLFDKFNNLSTTNNFTNPFYYYLWNIPLNFLPWSIFSIIGIIYQIKTKKKIDYLLVYFPILFIFILSLFSTKTPYYVLPISPILSLNAFIGLKELIQTNRLKFLLIEIASKVIPILIFITIFIYFLIFKESINLNFKEETLIITGLLLSSIILISINYSKKSKFLLLSIIISPYLFGLFIVQSGLLTDRSRTLRETIEFIISKESLSKTPISVVGFQNIDNNAMSKLIKISLLTPNLGEGIKDLKDLKPKEFAWIIEPQNSNIISKQYEIIASDNSLNPWKLIRK